MKRLIILAAFLILCHSNVFSQGCLPEGITFTTQEQIDNFQANYPGCTEILGSVMITDWGSEITNLNELEVLTSLGGNLEIYESHGLTSLTGLDNLTYIGGNLYIGNSYYGGNNSLSNLSGLNNLTSIEGNLGILYNNDLLYITDLEGLSFIGGGIFIFGNEALTSLIGLDNVSSIGGALQILHNPVLYNLSGLKNLTSIAGDLYFSGNDTLANIYSLIELTSVAGNIWITANGNLSSLAGLNNIDAYSIDSIKINYNNILSDCDVQSICEYLASPNGTIEIHDNATGCNSQEEVQEACSQSCLPAGITFTTQEQIDNFQTNYPGCAEIEGDVRVYGNEITNLNGLNFLTSIGGWLWIDSTMLQNLTGLNNLSYIGGWFHITYNIVLEHLTGLEALTCIGGELGIAFSEVNDLTGLQSLTTVGGLEFYYTGIESLEGLVSLTSINGNLNLDNCFELTSTTGLENITSIDGNLVIFITNLTSLNGLENIDKNSFTSIHISLNDYLSDCDAQSICEFLASPNGTIEIHDNAPGCNSPEEVEAACLTSVEENTLKDEISLFPNPATEFITITTPQGQPVEEIIIYNHLGKKVLSDKPLNNTVNVSVLKPGLYFIEVAAIDWRGRTKVIKQ